jgi:hypothetical protein
LTLCNSFETSFFLKTLARVKKYENLPEVVAINKASINAFWWLERNKKGVFLGI